MPGTGSRTGKSSLPTGKQRCLAPCLGLSSPASNSRGTLCSRGYHSSWFYIDINLLRDRSNVGIDLNLGLVHGVDGHVIMVLLRVGHVGVEGLLELREHMALG